MTVESEAQQNETQTIRELTIGTFFIVAIDCKNNVHIRYTIESDNNQQKDYTSNRLSTVTSIQQQYAKTPRNISDIYYSLSNGETPKRLFVDGNYVLVLSSKNCIYVIDAKLSLPTKTSQRGTFVAMSNQSSSSRRILRIDLPPQNPIPMELKDLSSNRGFVTLLDNIGQVWQSRISVQFKGDLYNHQLSKVIRSVEGFHRPIESICCNFPDAIALDSKGYIWRWTMIPNLQERELRATCVKILGRDNLQASSIRKGYSILNSGGLIRLFYYPSQSHCHHDKKLLSGKRKSMTPHYKRRYHIKTVPVIDMTKMMVTQINNNNNTTNKTTMIKNEMIKEEETKEIIEFIKGCDNYILIRTNNKNWYKWSILYRVFIQCNGIPHNVDEFQYVTGVPFGVFTNNNNNNNKNNNDKNNNDHPVIKSRKGIIIYSMDEDHLFDKECSPSRMAHITRICDHLPSFLSM